MIKQKIALILLDRDGMRCRFCANLATDIHHIYFKGEGIIPKDKVDSLPNLCNLCRRCHSEIHSYSPRGKILNIKAKTWSMNSFKWDKTTKEKMRLKLIRLK